MILLAIPVLAAQSCKKDDIPTDGEETIIPCLPQQLQASAIAFYSFSGGSLADISGRGGSLAISGSPRPDYDRNGNKDCAYRFNAASGDFLVTSNTPFLNSLPGLTVSLWYKPMDSTRSGGAYEVLVSRDSSARPGDRHGQWAVTLYDCRKVYFVRHSGAWDKHITQTGPNTCDNEIKLRTGSWHHVAATWSSSGNLMSLYRDGVLQDTSSIIYRSVKDQGSLFVGRYYTGVIDDIIIFNRELAAREVQQLSTLETCCNK